MTAENDPYHEKAVWLSRLVNRGRRITGSPFLAGLMVGGWIPVVATLVAVDPGEASRLFLVGQWLACLMVVVGPFDVWYFDERLLPGFFEEVDEVLTPSDDETSRSLAKRYDTYYATYWWVNVGVWAVLVLGVFVVSQPYLLEQGITTPVERAASLCFFLYWLTIVGLRSHAAIVTVLAIRAFAENATLDIDPLHPDGLGGLSAVGDLAIQVTLIISLGSFALPLSFQLASEVAFGGFVYAGVGLFVLLIALNFLYPTYKMNRRAQSIRERLLEQNRRRIRRLEAELAVPADIRERSGSTDPVDNTDASEPSDADTAASAAELGPDSVRENELVQLEIQRARREFRDHQNVQLYPLSVGIITRLASSILLPICFILFEFFISGQL
jgi:hypothetical protein